MTYRVGTSVLLLYTLALASLVCSSLGYSLASNSDCGVEYGEGPVEGGCEDDADPGLFPDELRNFSAYPTTNRSQSISGASCKDE